MGRACRQIFLFIFALKPNPKDRIPTSKPSSGPLFPNCPALSKLTKPWRKDHSATAYAVPSECPETSRTSASTNSQSALPDSDTGGYIIRLSIMRRYRWGLPKANLRYA